MRRNSSSTSHRKTMQYHTQGCVKSFCLRGPLLDANLFDPLCKLFTSSKTQARIMLVNTVENPFDLVSEVPQGSVISPILFIMYNSYIPTPIPKSNDICCADDFTQIITHPSKAISFMTIRSHQSTDLSIEGKSRQTDQIYKYFQKQK